MGDLNFLYLRCRDVNVLFSGQVLSIDPVDKDFVNFLGTGIKFINADSGLPEVINNEIVYLDQLVHSRYMVYKLATHVLFKETIPLPAILLFDATFLPLGEEFFGKKNLLDYNHFYNELYKKLSVSSEIRYDVEPEVPWKSLWRM